MAYTVEQLATFFKNANAGTSPSTAQIGALTALANQNAAGGLTNEQAFAQTVDLASDSTVAVSVGTYQFFLGYAPSEAGLASLNAAYVGTGAQANLNGENRFIAQSISLALNNAGAKSSFAGTYGSLTIADATALAYNIIIGNATATAAGVNVAGSVSYLSGASQVAYYTAFVKANVPGLSAADLDLAVKAAIVGEILYQATIYNQNAGLGSYATASNALVKDLADDGHLANNNTAGVNIFTNYGTGAVGATLVLTTGVDTLPGTGNDDTINAVLDDANLSGTSASTLTALDSINGGAGNDTLNLNVLTNSALPNGLAVTSVETVNLRSAVGFTGDFSTWNGLNTLNATQGVGVDLTTSDTTNVNVSGQTAGNNIVVEGSNNVSVTAANNNTYVGTNTAVKGAVTITSTATGNNDLYVDGGSTVTINATGVKGADIEAGYNGTGATGAVTINSTGAAYTAGAGSYSLGSIYAFGGTSITVNQVASSSLTAAATDAGTGTITQAGVNIDGDTSTTSVTVNQSAAQDQKAYIAAAGSKATNVVQFTNVAANVTVTVGGLSFTSAQALTAAQVASAFANLTSGATHGSAATSLGIYSGTFTTASTGTVSATNTVTATAASNGVGAAFTPTNATTTYTAGVATQAGVTGVEGIAGGEVNIDGRITGADVLATVSLSGWGASSDVWSDALTTLNLSKSNQSLTVHNTAATALSVTLDAVGTSTAAAALNFGATYTSLALSVTSASVAQVAAADVTALTVSGAATVDLSSSSFGALKTVVVTGAAGVTLDASGSTVTSVNTSGTTGANSFQIDASKATYTGGAGVDTVVLTSATVSKAISLGGGDDSVSLASGTIALGAVIDGGAGTDTLIMDGNNAATVSGSATFATKITGFEHLSLRTAGGHGGTVNLANLNNIAYVISDGGSNPGTNQASSVTITRGTAEAGDTFNVNLAGTVYSFTTTGAENATAVAAALISLINGGSSGITASAGAAGVINLSSPTAFSVGTTVSDAGTVDATISNNTTVTAIAGDALTLTNFAANGTVELTGAALSTTVTLADATGTSDVLNLVTRNGATTNFGTITAAGVETINLNAIDSTPTSIGTHSVTLADTALKSLVISGNANVSLSFNSTVLNTINASASTGGLTAGTSAGSASATTILGGSGADSLTANHNNDVLNGGAGADTLIVNADLVTLTGGAGADAFNVAHATTNVNSYATITDLGAGDSIVFNSDAVKFAAAKITLGNTAVFQDYANAAIANSADGVVSWFTYGGDTYVVENATAGSTSVFTNGLDLVVKITGTSVDLSTASFSSSTHALYIG